MLKKRIHHNRRIHRLVVTPTEQRRIHHLPPDIICEMRRSKKSIYRDKRNRPDTIVTFHPRDTIIFFNPRQESCPDESLINDDISSTEMLGAREKRRQDYFSQSTGGRQCKFASVASTLSKSNDSHQAICPLKTSRRIYSQKREIRSFKGQTKNGERCQRRCDSKEEEDDKCFQDYHHGEEYFEGCWEYPKGFVYAIPATVCCVICCSWCC